MTDVFDLDAVDTDGAIREAAEHVDAPTRAAFLRKAALGAGGLVAGGALIAPGTAFARSAKLDYRILNFALTLEYLEAEFYRQAVDNNMLTGPVLDFAKLVATHEQTHVSALRGALKARKQNPVASPKFDFGDTVNDQVKFLETSFALENEGVKAYLGQAGRLKSGAFLRVAATIVTTEARHAAGVAVLLGRSPFTGSNSITPEGAFDTSANRSTVLKTLGKTGFIVN